MFKPTKRNAIIFFFIVILTFCGFKLFIYQISPCPHMMATKYNMIGVKYCEGILIPNAFSEK